MDHSLSENSTIIPQRIMAANSHISARDLVKLRMPDRVCALIARVSTISTYYCVRS